jgi:hypothetical protein
MNIINVADIVDSTDPQGRTVREVNRAKTHAIPIGALVEVGDDRYPDPSDGIRLWVVHHSRDCDQTPLYELAPDRDDTVKINPRFRNPKWVGGYSEDGLKVIRLS